MTYVSVCHTILIFQWIRQALLLNAQHDNEPGWWEVTRREVYLCHCPPSILIHFVPRGWVGRYHQSIIYHVGNKVWTFAVGSQAFTFLLLLFVCFLASIYPLNSIFTFNALFITYISWASIIPRACKVLEIKKNNPSLTLRPS